MKKNSPPGEVGSGKECTLVPSPRSPSSFLLFVIQESGVSLRRGEITLKDSHSPRGKGSSSVREWYAIKSFRDTCKSPNANTTSLKLQSKRPACSA